jgi:hypothetical protein
LQLALGPQVLLEEPGVLRPAELVEDGEDDLPDRRPRFGGPDAGARGAPQLVDQFVATPVKPFEHGGLGHEVSGGHLGLTSVIRESAREEQCLFQRGNELVADVRHGHIADCTRQPWS